MCLEFKCIKCEWRKCFYTSKEVKNDNRGASSYEVNYLSIIAMREIGRGHTSLSTLCGIMNLPPPMNIKAYNDMQEKIASVYKEVANQSMQNAANEFRFKQQHDRIVEMIDNNFENAIADITVSGDGSWQKRGFSSLNVLVTLIAIDSGKCVDYRILTKSCSSCSSWELRKDTEPELYEKFLESHKCLINHTGSAGSMEAAGLVDCFMSSAETRKLRYTHYVGDGDSKAYLDIVKNDPYPGTVVEKLECVGHIQKRVGNRLRNLRNTVKTLKGRGRLTDKIINKLQNYYGLALRQSTGTTVYQLKKGVGAVLFHCSEASDLDTRHQMCPSTKNSWCKYQADKLNGTNTYKEKPGLPSVIKDTIRPVFVSLIDDNLLQKYLYGKTQNNNESLNGLIWKRCPKDVFVGRVTLELGVASAVIAFNDGLSGIIEVFNKLNIKPRTFCEKYCGIKDEKRITQMDRKSSNSVKQRRKKLRAHRKGFPDKCVENEGVSYEAELF